MEIGKVFANVGLYTAGVILSCGPSQVYGVIKGAIDLVKLVGLKISLSQLKQHEKALNKHAITQIKNEIEGKKTSLKADAVAMIPLIGAIFSWRVLAPPEKAWSLNALKGVEHAAAHMLNDFHSQIRAILYPLGNDAIANTERYEQARALTKQEIVSGQLPHAKLVEIPVAIRSSHLEALELTHPKTEGTDPPTVVLFHGNAMIGPEMLSIGHYYFSKGFNVLMPTMGGYPGSPGCKTSEATSYQDVEAIKSYLINKGVKDVGYHGLSIGGTLAFQAATAPTSNTEKLRTKFVVADQTLASARDVMATVVRNLGFGAVDRIAKGVALNAAPPSHKVAVGNGEYVYTDGCDNLKKAKILGEKKIPLFAIEADQDALMKNNANSAKDAAGKLISNCYGKEESGHLIRINGPHSSYFYQWDKDYSAFEKTMDEALSIRGIPPLH
ncbi:hypothetical protein [Estrella lausannensis]|uniref:Putative membrane protein n=1 Tax=Estrella lausannensis TaxID=483423 RepID=A0A0H5DP33_9BACT|nr:hypothetical protein [Estrella lausannensis]CRX38241.1 putative membrane protein [Estrella lausannensis]